MENLMQNKLFSVMYAINIVMQAILTLITPAALMFFIALLFIKRVGAPEWLYAVLIPIGVIGGLVSMVKFALSATTGLERLEKQTNNKTKTERDKNEKQ